MRVVPHRAREHDLDLLPAREAGDLVVVRDVRVEAQVGEMLRDDFGLQVAETEALARGLVVVELLHELAEAEVEEGLARDLGVVLGQEAEPLDFVLEALLPLLPAHEVLDAPAALAVAKVDELVHLELVFGRQNARLLHQYLAVVAVGVPPLEILVGRLLHMHLDVLERMLLNVPDAQIGVLLDLANLRYGFAGEKLDERGFAGAVGADDGGAGGEGEGACHVLEGGFARAWVGIGTVGHADDGARIGLHAGEDAGRWEFELDLGGGEGVVRFAFGFLLNESRVD